jgi:thioredoxin 1
MSERIFKIAIVAAVVLAIGMIVYIKSSRGKQGVNPPPVTDGGAGVPAGTLPKLVDLGSDQCIPCKEMAPILAQLRQEFIGRIGVVFIDVKKNPDEGEKYGIRLIPTQIFYDASGKEVFRHEGFFSRQEILAKFKEMGIDVSNAGDK